MDTIERLWTWEMTHLPLLTVVFCGFLLVLYLLDFYRPSGSKRQFRGPFAAAPFEFEPESLGGSPYAQLAWASLLGLYLELLMIRLVSSEIRIFAYLKNFVLIPASWVLDWAAICAAAVPILLPFCYRYLRSRRSFPLAGPACARWW